MTIAGSWDRPKQEQLQPRRAGRGGAGRAAPPRPAREGIALGAKLPGWVVAMETCCGAHHMGRALTKQGHSVQEQNQFLAYC